MKTTRTRRTHSVHGKAPGMARRSRNQPPGAPTDLAANVGPLVMTLIEALDDRPLDEQLGAVASSLLFVFGQNRLSPTEGLEQFVDGLREIVHELEALQLELNQQTEH